MNWENVKACPKTYKKHKRCWYGYEPFTWCVLNMGTMARVITLATNVSATRHLRVTGWFPAKWKEHYSDEYKVFLSTKITVEQLTNALNFYEAFRSSNGEMKLTMSASATSKTMLAVAGMMNVMKWTNDDFHVLQLSRRSVVLNKIIRKKYAKNVI